jgi:hypothetical protein
VGIARLNFKEMLAALLPEEKEAAPKAPEQPKQSWIKHDRGRGNFAQRW